MTIKQHSALWRATKSHYLGANDCASILGHGFNTIDEIIKSKVTGRSITVSSDQQERMDRGTKYENHVRKEYANRHNITIRETGLKFHKQFKFLTASPDGMYIAKTDGSPSSAPTLTEFKVLKQLSDGNIPLKYWIQMQIQMAVWGINRCAYCENTVDDITGKITDYFETFVEFDSTWFYQDAMPLISQAWNTIEQQRSACRGVKRKIDALESDESDEESMSIYPYNLVNFIRNDPLLDWLNKYGKSELKDKSQPKFFTMVNRLKNQFSYLVKNHLKQQCDLVNIKYIDIDMYVPSKANSPLLRSQIPVTSINIEQTRSAMMARTPVIFNGTFSIMKNNIKLKGTTDILILNEYIGLLGVNANANGNVNANANGNVNANGNANANINCLDPQDKYSLVQIQYSTLEINKDNMLMNNDKQRAYKVKSWFLNNLLTEIQGYCSENSYMICRSYQSKQAKVTNSFGNIAVIKTDEHQQTYEEALDWNIKLRTSDLSLVNVSFNMKNHNDYPWHSYKVSLGVATKDITTMYKCGPKIRKACESLGITTWEGLLSDNVPGLCRDVHPFIVANTDTSLPLTLNLNLPYRFRFYLDFEMCGSIYDDFSTFPEAAKDTNCIFLIGVIAEDSQTGYTEYFSYVADSLDRKSELVILEQMFTQLRTFMGDHQDVIPLIHWGNAEKQMLTQSADGLSNVNFTLIDMCNHMRKNQIVFPGQFGYGLKEVGTVMKKLNLITSSWDDADISNGMDAMVEAIRIYKGKNKVKKDLFTNEIIKYNYNDCKVMYDIVKWGTCAPT
jgi:hypothetical protein